MNRPYIICHMMQSLDGRVACDMVDKISGNEYYTALEALNCPSQIEGKHSYQIHYCGFEPFKPVVNTPIDREAFFVASKSTGYSISVDTRGTLLWPVDDNENRLCIVSEQASVEYLDYLRSKNISFIAVGKKKIDLMRAMEILYAEFGIERVAVVGGGKINGAFIAAGLLDEISAMIAPGIDGRMGQPALIDGIANHKTFVPTPLKLKKVSTFTNGVIWARYTI